jgi:hypothetical protein
MSAWKRWQDYATMVFGVVVFISPLVFRETSHHTATLGAYVLGALLVVAGIVAALNRDGANVDGPDEVGRLCELHPGGFSEIPSGTSESRSLRTPRCSRSWRRAHPSFDRSKHLHP